MSHRKLTITSLLLALSILIPIVMPLKLIIPPASYTLASHVPIFLAMMMSPYTAAVVVIGSTLGFFAAGFPIVIVFRAASHLLFALVGAWYLKYHRNILDKGISFLIWNICVALLHALGEVIACLVFYTTTTWPTEGILYIVGILVGGGTIVHSIIDGYLARYMYQIIPSRYK